MVCDQNFYRGANIAKSYFSKKSAILGSFGDIGTFVDMGKNHFFRSKMENAWAFEMMS